MIKDFIRVARPHQYTKNLFIFLPAFFAFEITNLQVWFNGILAFIAFSLVASSVYTLNDWMDREEDRKHPVKKERPIAAGRIGKLSAFTFISILSVLGLSVSVTISFEVAKLLLLYFLINVAYSAKLKHIPLLDISIIAVGFIIRLLVGSEATDIALSHWIIVITFLLALFLALAKRRDDILIYLKTNERTRKVLDGYNLKYLDNAMAVTSAIVIVAYILWSISPEITEKLQSENVYMTSIFVFLGISRYMQITFVEEESGNPSDTLIKDRFLQLILFFWILSFIYILYL